MNTAPNLVKHRFLRCVAALVLATFSLSSLAADPVLRKFEKRYLGWKDVCAVLDMQIVSRNGKERDGKARTCLMVDSKDRGYLRVRILEPLGARGTEILSNVDDDGNRKQWLYIPASKRATPIDDKRAEQPFLGTDFTFVDLGLNLIDADDLKAVETGQCDGEACSAFDLPAREGEHHRRLWLITETGAMHHADISDGNGKKLKRMDIGAEQRGQGNYWIPSEVTMNNLTTGSKTIVSWQDIEFDTDLEKDYFDASEIYGTGGSRSPGK